MLMIAVDIVIWDSHPLALGAAPQQVYIDGISQLKNPHVTTKPTHAQKAPQTPNFDREAGLAVEYDGLPPLEPHSSLDDPVLFINVSQIHLRGHGCEIAQVYSLKETGSMGVALVKGGRVVCFGSYSVCGKEAKASRSIKTIDLHGGTIAYVASSYYHIIFH